MHLDNRERTDQNTNPDLKSNNGLTSNRSSYQSNSTIVFQHVGKQESEVLLPTSIIHVQTTDSYQLNSSTKRQHVGKQDNEVLLSTETRPNQ